MLYMDLIFPIVSGLIILIFLFVLYELCACLLCKEKDEEEETSILTDRTPAPKRRSRGRRSRAANNQEPFPAYQITDETPGGTRIVMPMLARNSVGQIVLLHQVDNPENYRILEEYHAAQGNSIYRTLPNQNQHHLVPTHQLYTWDSQATLASSSCHPTYPQTPTAPPPPYTN